MTNCAASEPFGMACHVLTKCAMVIKHARRTSNLTYFVALVIKLATNLTKHATRCTILGFPKNKTRKKMTDGIQFML